MDGGPFPLFQDMYLHVQCKKVKVVSNAKRINLQNYQKNSKYIHFYERHAPGQKLNCGS